MGACFVRHGRDEVVEAYKDSQHAVKVYTFVYNLILCLHLDTGDHLKASAAFLSTNKQAGNSTARCQSKGGDEKCTANRQSRNPRSYRFTVIQGAEASIDKNTAILKTTSYFSSSSAQYITTL